MHVSVFVSFDSCGAILMFWLNLNFPDVMDDIDIEVLHKISAVALSQILLSYRSLYPRLLSAIRKC